MFKKIAQFLFGSGQKIQLSCLKEVGEKTLQSSGDIYSRSGEVIAKFENYTQQVEKIMGNNKVGGVTSVRSRVYKPEPGTRLANLGVQSVETTHTPFGNGLMAKVASNGKIHQYNRTQLRDYIRLANIG